jgi:hypothetical protein
MKREPRLAFLLMFPSALGIVTEYLQFAFVVHNITADLYGDTAQRIGGADYNGISILQIIIKIKNYCNILSKEP